MSILQFIGDKNINEQLQEINVFKKNVCLKNMFHIYYSQYDKRMKFT